MIFFHEGQQEGGVRIGVALEFIACCHFLNFDQRLRIVSSEVIEVEVIHRLAEAAEAFLDEGHFEEHGRGVAVVMKQGVVEFPRLGILFEVEKGIGAGERAGGGVGGKRNPGEHPCYDNNQNRGL